ncbi:hypothetical protein FNV43_RR05267 [Rhamnella rubrinervis]|uniref:EngB-type G domain-containing protein n=1 Tax=Rhamnella rubrinervis TaxID=2594499 RepID=A0A8K0MQX7_9ROSA|nr:hypothetical protein FNV43_RR05267 [Rhamnella rubrinervis]
MSADALRFKLNKKLKVGASRPNNSKNGGKNTQSSHSGIEDGGKGKSKLGLKDKNSHTGQEGIDAKRKLRPMSSDRTRKRIYANQETDKELVSYKKKTLSGKERKRVVKDDSVKGKNSNASSRSMWVSGKLDDGASESKRSSRKVKNAVKNAQVSDTTWAKEVARNKSVKVNNGDTNLSKKHSRSKFGPSKGLDEKPSPSVSVSNSAKKNLRDRKSPDEDIEGEQPKKKSKRVIRIDPYDISNKRLDDGIAIFESTKEKKRDLEEKADISKNAQFREIQPSPSILSFVEDNLLGRRRLIELQRAGYNTELSAPLDNIPFSTSTERERIEENVFRNKLTFFAAAKVSSSFPPPDLPEIAFAGKSNVGKSSLLNALTRQWGVVRTSDKPGLTQTINFFTLGSKLSLVDLPGYGFAYAKEEVKDAWVELVKEYVSTRVGLKRVCVLIDTKWGMKPTDLQLIDLMERAQTKYQIVLTKTDLVFPIDVARRATQIEESLKAHKSVVQPVMMVSSKSGAGIRSLRTVLTKIARFAKL